MDQALSILSSLGVNQTFFLMFGVIIVFYVLMNLIALKPLSKILIERDHRIEGRHEAIREYSEEAQSLELNFSDKIKEAHREAASDYAKIKAEALQKQTVALSQARESAQSKIAQVRSEVSATVESEFAKVSAQIPGLASLVMDRILAERGANKSNKSVMSSEV